MFKSPVYHVIPVPVEKIKPKCCGSAGNEAAL